MQGEKPIAWPRKYDLFGAQVSATSCPEAEEAIIAAAKAGIPAVVTHLPVHGIATAARHPAYRRMVNAFEIVAADGQPVRWALNRFHGTGLQERVYGPDLMLRLCARAAREGISVYLYGSSQRVIRGLRSRLVFLCPGLKIAGAESPPFRSLTAMEDEAIVERINRSGAGLLFIGLGLPKQDRFAYEHRRKIRAVQLCVGAAFDFHAGTKAMAPQWMQRRGLEWLFRLIQEPGRLWRRYLETNTLFVALVARRLVFGR